MESSVEVLEKLKRRVTLKLSLEEIEPVYRQVFRQLRNVRMNGFRSGKFPKGWLEKRFKTVMHQEAIEKVLPEYVEEALKKNDLHQATQSVVTEIEFERKLPLKAVIEFEVKPTLDPPDCKKIRLTRLTPEPVKDDEIEEEIQLLLKSRGQLLPREKGAEAEAGNWVSLKIRLEDANEDSSEKIHFELGGKQHKDFFEAVMGMKEEDTKTADVSISSDEKEGKPEKKTYEIHLTLLQTLQLPELNESLFKELEVADLDELNKSFDGNLQKRNQEKIQAEYRNNLSSQLPGLYKDFDLPEALIQRKEHELEHQFEEKSKELSSKEKAVQKEADMKSFRENLKLYYITDAIGRHEKILIDRDSAAGEFFGMASMFNQSPEDLINTPFGGRMFNQILDRQHREAVLDRVIVRVFGDPVDSAEKQVQENR